MSVAALFAYATTPIAILAARRFAFYDHPAGYKGHAAPTPYLGGAAVTTAFVLALLLGAGAAARTLPLVAGVGVMLTLGTIDDRRSVSPQLRVGVEFALGAGLSLMGGGWHLGAGAGVDALVNGLWVVGVVNAFNLFDNMDGAASAMAIAAGAGTCILAGITGNVWAATGCAALCGACLGFLPHNLARPAKIFLGDGGSMPLGFAVAALTASAARRAEPSVLALLTGLLLVGIPVLDTTLVIVSRRRRGLSILTAGRDHLTHRTRRRMGTAARVALVLGSAQALVSGLVVVATRAGSATVVYLLLAFVVAAVAAIIALESQAAPALGKPDEAMAAARIATAERAGSAAPWLHRLNLVALIALGLGAGLSALFSAYYSAGVWVPLGLVLVVAAAAAAVARPLHISRPAGAAQAGLGGLGLWSRVSTGWAESVEQATVDGNRWLAYTALLLLIIVLVRGRRHAGVLLAAVGVGVVVVAATVLIRLFVSDPSALFLSGRLNSPLGYINGEGCFFAMGCWMSLALAERREAVLAGLGAGLTVVMACLTLLSQSRGAAIATLVALVVVLAAAPGRRRRVLALAAVAVGTAVAASSVLHLYSVANTGPLPASVARHAVIATLLGAAIAGLGWGLVVALAQRFDRQGAHAQIVLRRAATILSAIIIALPLLAAGARASSIERMMRNQWHAFVHLSDPAGASSSADQTRLLSGSGNRYDYWRIAWQVFSSHPIAGAGAGNYAASYYRQRRTQESIENPHSIELQTASELGLAGLGLLALLVSGVAVGARRLARAARRAEAARMLVVAATGAVVVWLVDTSGDWMHLLPGVTAVALIAAAVLLEGARSDHARTEQRRLPRTSTLLAAPASIAFLLAVTGASLLRSGLVQHYLDNAHAEFSRHPAAAIQDARRALRLDSADLNAYYVEAAGQARFDLASAARSTLLAAVRQDPESFVTWTLLGDLEVRLRNFPVARNYYRRASALDPNDPSLARLKADPRSAIAGSR